MVEVNLKDLQSRSLSLYDAMIADPNRPYWQAELTRCVVELSDLMTILASDLASSVSDLEALLKRIESLEHRYSELLYRMSQK